VAEVILVVAAFGLPLALGVLTAYLARPWWWGALVAIALFWIAAIAPEPEEGESRLAAGDVVFLLVVSLVVAGLTWLGAWAYRRLHGPVRA
jgi:hypothetical protein